MPSVSIPYVGVVNFPDDMSHEDISNAIQNHILPNAPHPAATQPGSTSLADTLQQSIFSPVQALFPSVGTEPSTMVGSLAKGVQSLKDIGAQAKLSDLIPLQELDKEKYGPNFERAPTTGPQSRENLLATREKVNQYLGQLEQSKANAQAIDAKYGVDPLSKKITALEQTKDFKDASAWEQTKKIGSELLSNFTDLPEYIANVGLSSLPQSIAMAVASKVGASAGITGAMVAGGASSAFMEYGNEYVDLREQGFTHEQANDKAAVKSGIIGLLDAVSLNSAGKVAEKIFGGTRQALKETAKDIGKEIPKQAALGAAGEGFGSYLSNQPVNPRAIMEEALGEVFGAPGEAMSTYQGKRLQQIQNQEAPVVKPEPKGTVTIGPSTPPVPLVTEADLEGEEPSIKPPVPPVLPHTFEEIMEKGEPVETKQEAEKAHSDGDTVYGFHEQDEEHPVLIKDIDQLKGYTPDQLMVVPKEETPTEVKKEEPTSNNVTGVGVNPEIINKVIDARSAGKAKDYIKKHGQDFFDQALKDGLIRTFTVGKDTFVSTTDEGEDLYYTNTKTDDGKYSLKDVQNAVDDVSGRQGYDVDVDKFMAKYPDMLDSAWKSGFLKTSASGTNVFPVYSKEEVEKNKKHNAEDENPTEMFKQNIAERAAEEKARKEEQAKAPKTKAEINRERQQAKKEAAEKKKKEQEAKKKQLDEEAEMKMPEEFEEEEPEVEKESDNYQLEKDSKSEKIEGLDGRIQIFLREITDTDPKDVNGKSLAGKWLSTVIYKTPTGSSYGPGMTPKSSPITSNSKEEATQSAVDYIKFLNEKEEKKGRSDTKAVEFVDKLVENKKTTKAEKPLTPQKKLDDFLARDKNNVVQQMADNYGVSKEYAEKYYNATKEYLEDFAKYGYAPNPDPDHEKKLTIAENKYRIATNKIQAQGKKNKETKKTVKPQEFTNDELNLAARIVYNGNGIEYEKSVLPILKKLQDAGLIKLQGTKVFLTQESKDAGIPEGSSFSQFSDSEDVKNLRNFLTKGPKKEEVKIEKKPAEEKLPKEIVEYRNKANQYWTEKVAPQLRNYFDAFRSIGNERLSKAQIKPEEMSATEFLMKYIQQQSKFKGANQLQKTGIQELSIKDLWPTNDGKGEALRKSMLAAVKAVKSAPSTNYQWIKNIENGSETGLEEIKKEKPAEEHIEPNKVEPVTPKTIEKSIEKAQSRVDYKKIKQAISNQFDQAIKRATIQTEKEWDASTKERDSFVKIDIPGDGKFKVANNVERLEDLKKKLINAAAPKAGGIPRAPSAASVSSAETAFKNFIEEQDFENAIKYAELKGLDMKEVKLTPDQRKQLDKYIKNPTAFEEEKAEVEKQSEDYVEAQKENAVEKLNLKEEKPKSGQVFPAPAVNKKLFEGTDKLITEKPNWMDEGVWNQYERFQAGNFSMPTASFQGAERIKKGNEFKKEAEKNYKEAARIFLRFASTAKFPTARADKLILEKGSYIPARPIEKKITGAFTEPNIKKAVYELVDPKEVREALRGAVLEPDKTVSTDGKRLLIVNTKNNVTEPTIVDKDGKVIEAQIAPYKKVLEKYKDLKPSHGVNAEALGDYARGVIKGHKYAGNTFYPITLVMGKENYTFNAEFIEELTNAFRQLGYPEFNIGIQDKMLKAVSPDGKVTQLLMGMIERDTNFLPFNINNGYPSFKSDEKLGEEYIIEGEATDISNRKLLAGPVDELSEQEQVKLEEHYGAKRNSREFFTQLKDDVIRATNEGIGIIDSAIRDIIAKIQAGVLAVAIIFNPAYMSEGNYVMMPTKERSVRIEQVRAEVPAEAEGMSDAGKHAYSMIAPTQSGIKYFTIVDKPTATAYVFNPDGSLKTSSKVLLGKAFGDSYVGQVQFMQNRQTPAGMFTINAEKGNLRDYDGKTIYTLSGDKGAFHVAVMHTVYTKESDGKARLNALTTPGAADSRYSHGCINGTPEFMQSINDEKMDQSHMFVVPDNQAKVDDFLANNVPKDDLDRMEVKPVERQVVEEREQQKVISGAQQDLLATREEEIKAPKTQAEINRERQQAKKASQEKPEEDYRGTFTDNLDERRFFKEESLSNKQHASEQARKVKTSITKILRQMVKGNFGIETQRELTELLSERTITNIEKKYARVRIDSADAFLARAIDEVNLHRAYPKDERYGLKPEVLAVIKEVNRRFPNVLEGLKLSIKKPTERGSAGNFAPLSRIVTLYKDTSGTSNPSTFRHEIMHSLEQMMPDDVYMKVINNWAKSLAKAIENYTDEKHQKYFDAVLDYISNPNDETYKKAKDALPNYNMYQYINPSEFWAVNAEKLFGQKLGGRWENFKRAVQKLFEGLKSVFGFDNRYGVHVAFDRLFKGDLERGDSRRMLVDYLQKNDITKESILENIDSDEINELADKHGINEPPEKLSPSVVDWITGGAQYIKNLKNNLKESPRGVAVQMTGNLDNALLGFRIKTTDFTAGLTAADADKYNRELENGMNQAIASVASNQALRAIRIASRVVARGKLVFDPQWQMFRAQEDKHSMANIFQLRKEFAKRVGKSEARKAIQGFFEALRSKSIIQEYVDRQANLEEYLAEQADPTTDAKRQAKLIKLINEAQDDLKNINIALEKVRLSDDAIYDLIKMGEKHPELVEIRKNWNVINQNMINMMEFSSMISEERANTLRNIKDYVPWNRIMDEQKDARNPVWQYTSKGVRNINRESFFRRGATNRDIDDIIDNMTHNVMMTTRNVVKNYAANRIAQEYAERNENGKIKTYPAEDFSKGIVKILVNGQKINVRIPDMYVAQSVIGAENVQIPLNGIMSFFANLARRAITLSPKFQIKQAFQDAFTAAMVTGVKNPAALLGNVFVSFAKGLNPNDETINILKDFGVGGFSGISRTQQGRYSQEVGMLNGNRLSQLTGLLDHIADASDYSQRAAAYNRVMAETGGDVRAAILAATNVIDFEKHGAGMTMQWLNRTIMFMNAYAQQIDVLTQALMLNPNGGLRGLDRQQALIRLGTAVAMMAGMTLLYTSWAGDDDEYQKTDDRTRMRNIILPKGKTGFDQTYYIPINTSASFLVKGMIEMLHNKYINESFKDKIDGTRFRSAMLKGFVDSMLGPLTSGPVPTAFRAPTEIILNHNFYTGGKVTPDSMKNLASFQQFNANTSELGKYISRATQNPLDPEQRMLNPMEADHVMRGLGGSVSAVAMYLSNMLSGNHPTQDDRKNPLYGDFIAPEIPKGNEELFYDLKSRAEMARGTMVKLYQDQHTEEAQSWQKAHEGLIKAYGFTESAGKSLAAINKEIQRTADLPESQMTKEQKKVRMTELQKTKQIILDKTIEFRKLAGL